MSKKTKMANICRSLRTKIFFSPVLKSPTHIGFTDVKKWVEISHLGTFKYYTNYVSCCWENKRSFFLSFLYRVILEEELAPLILDIEEEAEHEDDVGEGDETDHHQPAVHRHPHLQRRRRSVFSRWRAKLREIPQKRTINRRTFENFLEVWQLFTNCFESFQVYGFYWTKIRSYKRDKNKKVHIFAVFMVEVNVNLLNWLIVHEDLYVSATKVSTWV